MVTATEIQLVQLVKLPEHAIGAGKKASRPQRKVVSHFLRADSGLGLVPLADADANYYAGGSGNTVAGSLGRCRRPHVGRNIVYSSVKSMAPCVARP